jgi:hypothetical protein
MHTLGDLRRAIEGISDDVPMVLEFLEEGQRTRLPVGEEALLLSDLGDSAVFVLEPPDMAGDKEIRSSFRRRDSEVPTPRLRYETSFEGLSDEVKRHLEAAKT